MKTRLVIDSNSVYEIDEECMKSMQYHSQKRREETKEEPEFRHYQRKRGQGRCQR